MNPDQKCIDPAPAVPAGAFATPAALALHNNFKVSVKTLRRSLVRCLHYLLAIQQRKVHRSLGYATITDYAAAVAGFTRNQTEMFLSLAAASGGLPRGPCGAGGRRHDLVAGAGRRDARAAGRRAAMDRRRRRTGVRGLRTALRSRADDEPTRPGTSRSCHGTDASGGRAPARGAGLPAGAGAPADTRCHIGFALTPEEYARWCALLEALRKRGHKATGGALLVAAYEALAGAETVDNAAGGIGYHIVLTQCPTCGAAELSNSRGRFHAPEALIQAARCDAVLQREDGSRRSSIPPRIRRRILARDGHRCRAPGCRNTRFLEIHHRLPVAAGGKAEPDNLVTLCSRCHRELHRRESALREAGRDPVAGA